MFTRPDPSSGIPVYLQLVEQVKHAIATGRLGPGAQLPGVRPAAVDLVINPNTVVKAYRELEHAGFIEVRHGAGAFVAHSAPALLRTDVIRDAMSLVRDTVSELRSRGITPPEMRRLLESELSQVRAVESGTVNTAMVDTPMVDRPMVDNAMVDSTMVDSTMVDNAMRDDSWRNDATG